jgi:hypothetical protein
MGVVFVRNLTDFAVYYAAGRSLLSGRTDLYAPDFARGVVMDYRYLPVFILSLRTAVDCPVSQSAAWVWHLPQYRSESRSRSRRSCRCSRELPYQPHQGLDGRVPGRRSVLSRWRSITATCS